MPKINQPQLTSLEKVENASRQVEHAYDYQMQQVRLDPTSQIIGQAAQTINNASQLVNQASNIIQYDNYNKFSSSFSQANSEFVKLWNNIPNSVEKQQAVNTFFDDAENKLNGANVNSRQRSNSQMQINQLKDFYSEKIKKTQELEEKEDIATGIISSVDMLTNPPSFTSDEEAIKYLDATLSPTISAINDSNQRDFEKRKSIGKAYEAGFQTLGAKNPIRVHRILNGKNKDGEYLVKDIPNRAKLLNLTKDKAGRDVYNGMDNRIIKKSNIPTQDEIESNYWLKDEQKNDLLSKVLKVNKENDIDIKKKIIEPYYRQDLSNRPIQEVIADNSKNIDYINKSYDTNIEKRQGTEVLYKLEAQKQNDPKQFQIDSGKNVYGISANTALEVQRTAGNNKPRLTTNLEKNAYSPALINMINETSTPAEVGQIISGQYLPLQNMENAIIDPNNPQEVSKKLRQEYHYQLMEELLPPNSPISVAMSGNLNPDNTNTIGFNLINIGKSQLNNTWTNDQLQLKAIYPTYNEQAKKLEDKFYNPSNYDASSGIGSAIAETYGSEYAKNYLQTMKDYMLKTKKDFSDTFNDLANGQKLINNPNARIVYNPKREALSSLELNSYLALKKNEIINDIQKGTRQYYKPKQSLAISHPIVQGPIRYDDPTKLDITSTRALANNSNSYWIQDKDDPLKMKLILKDLSGGVKTIRTLEFGLDDQMKRIPNDIDKYRSTIVQSDVVYTNY